MVAASGNYQNSTHISYPACVRGATSVGATYKNDNFWSSTNRGPNLDLLAPGVSIMSTNYHWESEADFVSKTGTSMAAPHVAGAAALLLEKDPTLTPDEIEEALKKTDINIWDSGSGLTYPRIDVLEAINSLCVVSSWISGSCGAGDCSSFQREYTRTVEPAGCDTTSKCEYDESCISGATINVCKSGCSYSTIQSGLNAASYGDLVKVTDSAVYDEKINWSTSDSGVLLNCQGATITWGGWTIRIEVNENIGIINCILNVSSGIKVTGSGGPYDIKNNVFDLEQTGMDFNGNLGNIEIWDNIIINAANNEKGVYFHNGAGNSNIKKNTFLNNNDWAIYSSQSSLNTISKNVFEDNNYAIYLKGNDQSLLATIEDNNISGNNYGIYIDKQGDIHINNNYFCASNTNYDIYNITYGTEDSGTGNRCEKPDGWSDTGRVGCTYYCDEPPTVYLLDPLDDSVDTDGDVGFVCQAIDDSQLVNITLYHNITGTWQANQTKNISGVNNITTFNVENIADETVFKWNCLAYDNKSQGAWAEVNWSVNISIVTQPPNLTILSPLTTQITPNVEFNVSADQNLSWCGLSLNNGSNVTMTLNTSNTGAGFTNTTMTDGNLPFVITCNNTYNKFSSVNSTFLSDQINITVCRDLTVNGRNYSLVNDISIDNGDCLNIKANDTFLDCNFHNITGPVSSDTVINLLDNNTIIRNCKIEQGNTGVFLLDDRFAKIYDSNISSDNVELNIDAGARMYIINTSAPGYTVSAEPEREAHIYYQWYVEAQVNDTNGNFIENANVSFYNISNALIYTQLTDINGKITRQEITEKILIYNFTIGVSIYYHTPHTINVTKTGYIANSTTYNLTEVNNVYHSVLLSAPPNDTHKFYIKNASGDNVAWFGNLGNIVLKGNCTTSTNCTAPLDSFIIANSTDNTTAYIDNLGNLCIEKGDCSDQSISCNPTRDAFIIRNSTNSNMSYIDFDGDLCLTENLYENSEP